MRIVIDTNVLISSFIGRGTSQKVVEHCIRNHTVIVSEFILDELNEKLVEKFKYTSELADQAVGLLRSKFEVVFPEPLQSSVCRDPEDDTILATALSGECNRIITGDKDLLVLQIFEGIEIINPAGFSVLENIE